MFLRAAVALLALVSLSCAGCPVASSVPSFPVMGFVRAYPDGTPIAGAVIEVLDGPQAHVRATTDANGHYWLGYVSSGRLSIVVTAAGFYPLTATTTLEGDMAWTISLERQP